MAWYVGTPTRDPLLLHVDRSVLGEVGRLGPLQRPLKLIAGALLVEGDAVIVAGTTAALDMLDVLSAQPPPASPKSEKRSEK